MKELFKFLVLIFMSLCFSGCSLAFLASKQQGVTIEKDTSTAVLINKKSPILQNGKYVLKKKCTPQKNHKFRDEFKK